MPALALDIGSHSVKYLVGSTKIPPELTMAMELVNTAGIVVPSDAASKEKYRELLASIFKDNTMPKTDVRISLSESLVSTKIVEMPLLSDAELASAVGWQAERNIPIPPDQLSLQYQVLFRPARKEDGQMRVLLVGVRKQLVEEIVIVMNELGVEPSLIDTNMLALIRSLQFSPTDSPTLVADLGANSATISIVSGGELQFVISTPSGGQLLTSAIQKTFNLTPAQAEEYKRTFGMRTDQLEGKVKQVLVPHIDEIIGQMRKAIQFFGQNHPDNPVTKVVLAGGGALLPDLPQYITSLLSVEVMTITPFSSMSNGSAANVNPVVFGPCVGLLMRALE